jgi:hypothetical protein
MMKIAKFCRPAALIAAALIPVAAAAEPARVIILRHGEKHNQYRLCDVGIRRSHWPTIILAEAPRVRCFQLGGRRAASLQSPCIR